MPWPPTVPPATATNATVQADTHPLYHNQLATAINDTVSHLDLVADEGQAGMIAPSGRYGTTLVALLANRAYYLRFVPERTVSVTKIAFVLVTPSGTDDPVDVGIYSAAASRIVSSGATTGKLNAAAGRQEVSFTSTPLTAGTVYYAALSANSTASLMFVTGAASAAYLFGNAMPTAGVLIQATAHPLPSTATPTSTATAGPGPVLAVLL
jgi:hypothetical protein